jgi:hypothetical protein
VLEFWADLDRSLVEGIDVLAGTPNAKLVSCTVAVWPVAGWRS